MKIGVLASNFRTDLFKSLKYAWEMGMCGVQLSFHNYLEVNSITDEKLKTLQSYLDRYNLEISAFCGDMGGHGFCDEKENPRKIETTKKMIDVAKKLNVKVITSHVGLIPADKNKVTYKALKKALSEIGKYAEENGVTYAIETGPEIATTLNAFIEDIYSDGIHGIGVNLDPANFAMVSRQDPAEAVRILGKKIVHTHAKDGKNLKAVDPVQVYGSIEPGETHTNVPGVFKETPFGEGDVNWDEYIKALQEIGYDGYFTIERETRWFKKRTIQKAYDFLVKKLHKDRDIVVAIVGCGNIARGAHIPQIKRIKNYKLKYCVDIIPQKAQYFADNFGIKGYTKAITDYHDMLKDPEVEAVVVTTHTFLHAQIAIDAMKAGKHVLSEKPMALNSELAKEMVRVSEETGKISNVAVCCRYDTGVNMVKNIVDSGELGKIYSVYVAFRSFRNIPAIGGEFTNKAHSGGGVINDWGVHRLDLIMYILGSPKVISADACAYSELGKDIEHYHNKKGAYNSNKDTNGVYDVEEFVSGIVKTEGPSISLNGAWAQNIDINENYIDFMGTKAGIRLNYCGGFTLFTEKNGKFVKIKPRFIPDKMYYEEHRAFVKDILNDTRSRQYAPNVLNTAELLEALYKAAGLN